MLIPNSKVLQRTVQRYRKHAGKSKTLSLPQNARASYLSQASARDRAKAFVYQAEAKGARAKQSDTVRSIAQERIVGTSDLLDMNYLELAVAIARGVARIKLSDGAGTGFLVGPGLLMTNHHVLTEKKYALSAFAQFDYQEDQDGKMLPVQTFVFEPDRFFLTDPQLDFTLVALASKSSAGRSISSYPWAPLIESTGKLEKGDCINIIQHPLGGLKQIAFRNNTVIEIPPGKPDFLYYTTDTQEGSSGAPCFNDQWELVALHHSGVPKTSKGKILKQDGTPFREGQDAPASIQWIANEGARVSAIVKALKISRLNPEGAAVVRQLLDSVPPNPVALARESIEGSSDASLQSFPRSSNMSLSGSDLSVTVSLSGDSIQSVSVQRGRGPAEVITPSSRPLLSGGQTPSTETRILGANETTAIDPKWKDRKGYDSDFLGLSIPLPVLSAEQCKLTVEVPPEYRRSSNDKYTLHYHHYSLAFHAKRRQAWFSAANIDGDHRFKFERGKDHWYIDPRIDDPSNPSYQMGEELYAEASTDRGHLTRYLDVAWGTNKTEALQATNDTFHFTNCSLQLSGFNQGKDRWQGLEQYLLENKARKEKRRMTVITGPIFKSA